MPKVSRDGVWGLAKKAIAFHQYWRIYWQELRGLKQARAEGTFEALWAFLESSSLAGIAQVRSELENFLVVLKHERPRTVLEIGTAHGGTLLFWSWAAAKDAVIITVDLPHGPFGGGHRRSQAWFYRRFAAGSQRVRFVRGDSHAAETEKKIKRLLRGGQVDFLFIDGDHTYEGVRQDFERYGPLVRQGGIIAFHDIVPAAYEAVGGVPAFWDGIKHSMSSVEIIEDKAQGGFGIGLFYKEGMGEGC